MTEIINIDTQRDRAAKFAKQFETASYEMGQAQRFVTDFCEIFGINHRRLLNFEARIKKSGGKRGRIDAFIPSLLLVEMKSAGEDLDKAYTQATEYFHSLKNEELPRSVLVSDFQNLHLYNLETHAEPVKIKLAELSQKIDHFQFLAGYEQIAIENQQKKIYKTIDLFAGIGGIRLGFESHGCQNVFSSEWDKDAQRMYHENFGEIPYGDINLIKPNNIPNHDILLAGFYGNY
jgi:hypothetical protein